MSNKKEYSIHRFRRFHRDTVFVDFKLFIRYLIQLFKGKVTELAEGARLEIVCTVNSGTPGSNPGLSAKGIRSKTSERILFLCKLIPSNPRTLIISLGIRNFIGYIRLKIKTKAQRVFHIKI